MTSIPSTCTILGDPDIIGPGVRFSIYIQSMLILIRILMSKDEFVESVKFAAITMFSLIISALISDLSFVLLLLVTQLSSLLLIAVAYGIYSILYVHYINTFRSITKIEKRYFINFINFTSLLYSVVYSLIVCYNIWIWTVIKWRLPEEVCGDNFKLYSLTSNYPIGQSRNFTLAVNCVLLICFSGIVSYLLYTLCIRFLNSDEQNSIEKNSDEQNSDEENSDEQNSDETNSNSCIIFKVWCSRAIFLFVIAILATLIASVEQTVQKNPISGIWNWGFGQVLAMVLAVIDVLRTLNKFIEPYKIQEKAQGRLLRWFKKVPENDDVE